MKYDEARAQQVLTVEAFKEWAKKSIRLELDFVNMPVDPLNYFLSLYLQLKGFNSDTKLIDGTYVEYLVIKDK